jgi:hypothetical protein
MIYNNEAKGLWLVPALIVAQHDLAGFLCMWLASYLYLYCVFSDSFGL